MTYEEKLDEVLEWQKQQAEKDKKIVELEKRCNELFFQVNEKTERIAELEAQIEKMKCCKNCKKFDLGKICITPCTKYDKWEIKENE